MRSSCSARPGAAMKMLLFVAFTPSIAWGSETAAQYLILGWALTSFFFLFFPIFWWLFSRFEGFGFWPILFYVGSVALIVPFGISTFGWMAVPNWVVWQEGTHPTCASNLLIFALNTFIFFKTRSARKKATWL